jgi:NADH:ubiquinone oxidoreductase subunit K
MKKYLIVTLAMFVLGSFGVVLAQERRWARRVHGGSRRNEH